MITTAPDPRYPRVWVDFNACGWAGADDSCYYVCASGDLGKFVPHDGLVVCAYDYSDERMVVGCLARMERWQDRWRFCELPDTWFEVTKEALNLVGPTAGGNAG